MKNNNPSSTAVSFVEGLINDKEHYEDIEYLTLLKANFISFYKYKPNSYKELLEVFLEKLINDYKDQAIQIKYYEKK